MLEVVAPFVVGPFAEQVVVEQECEQLLVQQGVPLAVVERLAVVEPLPERLL